MMLTPVGFVVVPIREQSVLSQKRARAASSELGRELPQAIVRGLPLMRIRCEAMSIFAFNVLYGGRHE